MILDYVNHHLPVHFARLAEEKKEEGNQLYKLKSYRDALAKYSEAIGELTKFHDSNGRPARGWMLGLVGWAD